MIKCLKYHEIDFDRYANCLNNACQNTDYADKKFLDIVSDRRWFLLVYGDDKAIMPVSYVRKYGLTFILMPKFCKQLGVFSKVDDTDINQKFYDFLQENFLVVIYAFNGKNKFQTEVRNKTSYLINMEHYSIIKKNYSSHRRRNVRLVGNLLNNINFKEEVTDRIKKFFIKNLKGTANQDDKVSYFEIMEKLLHENMGHVKTLEFENNVQSFVYLYEGKNTRYLSLFINDFPLINSNLPSIMIDKCLQEFIGDKNFDFMGSEIENIAKFNKRFGAISYQYPILINSKLTLFKNLWRRYRIITNFAP